MSTTSSTLRPGPPVRRLAVRLAPRLWPLAVVNLAANIGIVVTGGAVRLTASGLGCPTWPRCTDDSVVPTQEMGVHGVIEFANRTLTFVLAAAALLTFLAALGAARRRAMRLSLLVGLGVCFQAGLGGITVLTGLNAWVVAVHFMVSMVLITVCVMILEDLRGPARPAAPAPLRRTAWSAFVLGWLVLGLGTVVTGAGPHAGDLDTPRNGLDTHLTSQVHAWSVYLLVAATVVALVLAHRAGLLVVRQAAVVLLVIEVGQGVIGYVQYFTALPVLLVGIHMLGASLTAAALVWLVLLLRTAPPAPSTQNASSGSSATATKSRER